MHEVLGILLLGMHIKTNILGMFLLMVRLYQALKNYIKI